MHLQARDELVDYVCKKEIGVYRQIFAPVGDTAQIDRVGEHFTRLTAPATGLVHAERSLLSLLKQYLLNHALLRLQSTWMASLLVHGSVAPAGHP